MLLKGMDLAMRQLRKRAALCPHPWSQGAHSCGKPCNASAHMLPCSLATSLPTAVNFWCSKLKGALAASGNVSLPPLPASEAPHAGNLATHSHSGGHGSYTNIELIQQPLEFCHITSGLLTSPAVGDNL
mmetsp:Transcript_18561/g.56061  ORF Transcript_18561/g.56061 Transcript_18561/m.56061 type:complete len:129 (+) Transcript_18561:1462-1848(+)